MSAILKHLTDFTLAACLVRLAMAALLGGIIGYERERHGRAAGLRTHILVCIGSATAVIGGLYVAYQLGFSNDPLRAGAQVISGIGFLGAGTILTRNGDHVIGLTTAAGLWATAAIGLIVGTGFYSFAIAAAAMVVVVMELLGRMEHGKRRRERAAAFYAEIDRPELVQQIVAAAAPHRVRVTPARSGLDGRLGLCITLEPALRRAEQTAAELRTLEGVAFLIPDDDM